MNSKSRKTIVPQLVAKVGNHREMTESPEASGIPTFPLERVEIFDTPLFYFTMLQTKPPLFQFHIARLKRTE
jgi:hypothetical protein